MATSRNLPVDAFQRFLMGKIALNPFTLNLEGYAILNKLSVESGRRKLYISLIGLLEKKELRKHADAKIFADFLCSFDQLKVVTKLYKKFLALLVQKDSPLGNIDVCIQQTFSPYIEGIGEIFSDLMSGIDAKTGPMAIKKRPHDEDLSDLPVKKMKSDANPDAPPLKRAPAPPGPPPSLPLPPLPEPKATSCPLPPRGNLKDHPLAKLLRAQHKAIEVTSEPSNAAALQRSKNIGPTCVNSDPFFVPSGSGTSAPDRWLIPLKPVACKSSASTLSSPTPVTGSVDVLSFHSLRPLGAPNQDSKPSISFLDSSAATLSDAGSESCVNDSMASFSSSFGPLPSREGAVDYSASLGIESMSSFLASLVPPEDVNNDVDGGDITGGSLSSSVKPLSALFSLIPPPAPGQDSRKRSTKEINLKLPHHHRCSPLRLHHLLRLKEKEMKL
ncbi:hypothetical protein BT96DRAFT_1019475 [Gymnopus androsaceus JB14]|uniref:Uncharacterized protein n=1 Tax=Gymnopus androsaceus JB14 TaxID=1447944 RepID=A0A6A4HMZ1_9AGAR|nr:hypothetical protein BT96DRAFT_1019475 [Gymnopus androsaceus JB14]